MSDDVRLTDLRVIQRCSLAVRGATASRVALVAALRADLDRLRGGRRPATVVRDSEPAAPAEPRERAPGRRAATQHAPEA